MNFSTVQGVTERPGEKKMIMLLKRMTNFFKIIL